MGGGWFYGLDPAKRSAEFMGDGNFKFSATNVARVGQAVSRVLANLEETAHRIVFVSSFEVSLNEILTAYKIATGIEDWEVRNITVDDGIKSAEARLKDSKGADMLAVARLGMAVVLKDEFGPNFAELGLLHNKLLGLEGESVDDTVAAVLKNGLSP